MTFKKPKMALGLIKKAVKILKISVNYYFIGDDNDKLSVLPGSTSGSLSSITTQSVASSEPDPNGVDGGDGGEDKNIVKQVIQEKWWQTTLQVSIPFLIAGIGTIGAGIILGRVEVSFSTIIINY